MEWNGAELIVVVMGGTVARASSNLISVGKRSSSSCCCTTISSRLLPVDKLLLLPTSSASSCCSSSAASITFSPHQNFGLTALRPSLAIRKSSVSLHQALTFCAAIPSRSRSRSSCSCWSGSSFSASESCKQLGGSLMSSRLAPAFSSFCGLTRLDGLIITSSSGSRSSRHHHHRGSKGAFGRHPPVRNAKASSVEIRSIVSSELSDYWCCWREGRGRGGVGGKLKSRCMETEKKGQRSECYSSSGPQAAAAADQPVSSSVLPPLPANPAMSKVKGMAISFCPRCGGATEEKIPVGEHEKRYVCTACGAVHYQNPKMVVGCLVEHEGKILLCRRNIEPSFGLWTLPAGYMEMGESAAEGAARETLEEACAHVQVLGLFAHIDIPLIGQSHIYFRAQMKDPHFAPGPESIECALFKLNEIPLDDLAFSSIQVALKMYMEDTKAGKMRVHHAVIDKRPGASPSDLKGFLIRDVLTS